MSEGSRRAFDRWSQFVGADFAVACVALRRTLRWALALVFGFCGPYLIFLFLLPVPEGVTGSPRVVIIVIPVSFVLLVVYAVRLVATASRMKKLLVSRGLVVRTAPDIRRVLGYQDWLSREGMTIDEVGRRSTRVNFVLRYRGCE